MLLIRPFPARFSENCICRIASSIGRPEIWLASLLSLRGEILKLAVEYLCCGRAERGGSAAGSGRPEARRARTYLGPPFPRVWHVRADLVKQVARSISA